MGFSDGLTDVPFWAERTRVDRWQGPSDVAGARCHGELQRTVRLSRRRSLALSSEPTFALRASVRRHRSNLERSIRLALTWRFVHIPTGAWRRERPSYVPRFGASRTETPPEKRSWPNRSTPTLPPDYAGHGTPCPAARPAPQIISNIHAFTDLHSREPSAPGGPHRQQAGVLDGVLAAKHRRHLEPVALP